MRATALDFNERSGALELSVKVDTRDTDHLNAIERRDNPLGYTKSRTMRAVAEIPYDFVQSLALMGDKDGAVLFDTASDPLAKRKALRSVLLRYPEFRVSDGRI